MTAAGMRVDVTWDAGECRVRAGGEIDMATIEDFRAALTHVADRTVPGCRVLVDVARVTFVSAAGMRVLLRSGERVRLAGGVFVVDPISPAVELILRACGYTDLVGLTPG